MSDLHDDIRAYADFLDGLVEPPSGELIRHGVTFRESPEPSGVGGPSIRLLKAASAVAAGVLVVVMAIVLVRPNGVESPAPAMEPTTTTSVATTTVANADVGGAHVYSGPHPLGVGYGISSGAGLLVSLPDGGVSPEVAWSEDGANWTTAQLSGVSGQQLDVLVDDSSADMPFSYVSSSDGVWWYDGSSFVPLDSEVAPGRLLEVGGTVFLMSFNESGPSLSVVDGAAIEALPALPDGVRWVASDGTRLVGYTDFMDGDPVRLWGSDDGSEWELLAEVAPSDLGDLAPENVRVDSYGGVLVAEAWLGDEVRYYVEDAGEWRELEMPSYPGFPLGLSSYDGGWMLMGIVDDTSPTGGMKAVMHVSSDLESWSEVDLSPVGDPTPGGNGQGTSGFLQLGDGRVGISVTQEAGQLDIWLFPLSGS
jgi:hypothetical protein